MVGASVVTATIIRLDGKVALVTGGSQRIGAEIVRSLHRHGMDILLHFRSSGAQAENLSCELNSIRADSSTIVQADLLESGTPEKLLRCVQQWRGRLDLLVNNASSFFPTPIGNVSLAQWDELMGSNLKAPFFLAQAAAPLLRANSGSIINLVDIHAERPLAGYSIYSIAKAGNAMLIKSLARELGPEIRVNGVAPGAILWHDGEKSEAVKSEILSRTTLKRAGTPADIASAVLFLTLNGDYISGQIITVDGGRSVQQ